MRPLRGRRLAPGARRRRLIATMGLAASVVLEATACRQEMYNQPKYKGLRQSDFFADGRQVRPLPEGTVARGFLREDARVYAGRAGVALATEFPIAVDAPLLARGRQRYDIYCAPCHDRTGAGQGMVVRRGFRAPPSFHIDRLRDAPVGHLYEVIANGFGAMPDYSAQIEVPDRWAIVAYVRALQLSQHAAVSELPGPERARLESLPPAPARPTPISEPAPFPQPPPGAESLR